MRKLLILALLLAAAGCSPHQSHPLQSKQAASGDWTLPYGKWIFAFITPYELPSMVNHAKPPQYIVFCWDSYIDQQTYETSAVFGPETWQRMKTPADHTRPSGAPVWYNRMVFGLSPGGKVKIWFSDVAGRPSLPVTPLKLTTRSGKDLTLCKDYVVPGGSFTFLPSTQAFINGKTYPYGNWD